MQEPHVDSDPDPNFFLFVTALVTVYIFLICVLINNSSM